MLGIHGQGIGEDLIHLATGFPPGELKKALDDSLRGGNCAPREIEIEDAALNRTRFIQLSCYPEKNSPKESGVAGAVLLLEDVTAQAARRRQLEKESVAIREQLERLSKQNDELLEHQRSLAEANKELAAANDELRSTNEHLLIAAEEAEASAEEVETLNEEMQATSEELETLNEELQSTVEELNTTNEELAARGREFEQLAKERQHQYEYSERQRTLFERALQKAPIIAALLDRSGVIRMATELYAEHAAANADRLPPVGEAWNDIPDAVTLSLHGATVKYRVTAVVLPGEGEAGRLVVLSA